MLILIGLKARISLKPQEDTETLEKAFIKLEKISKRKSQECAPGEKLTKLVLRWMKLSQIFIVHCMCHYQMTDPGMVCRMNQA